jgi:hypothetical protein
MNWLKNIFWPRAPKYKVFTIFWHKSQTLGGESTCFWDEIEVETGITWVTQHCAQYEAVDSAQARAMHRSDNPGCEPTSIITWT